MSYEARTAQIAGALESPTDFHNINVAVLTLAATLNSPRVHDLANHLFASCASLYFRALNFKSADITNKGTICNKPFPD